MYNSALQRLENDFGNATMIMTSFVWRVDSIISLQNKYIACISTGHQGTTLWNANWYDCATNYFFSSKTWKTTLHIPTFPITISYGNHELKAHAMLDCASNPTLLKFSIAFPLKLNFKLSEGIQFNQTLFSNETTSAVIIMVIELN